jgi:alkaline phosphatase D
MVLLGRRTALLAGVVIGGTPGLMAADWKGGSPALARARVGITSGARSGEVTTTSAVLWARAEADARMAVRLSSSGRLLRDVGGVWADQRTDRTARLILDGLAPGRRYDADVSFTASDGTPGPPERISFSTAPIHPAAQSFIWSGDTCGQGWGINPDLDGLTTYRAMLDTRPDFFVHCGDTIYADIEIEDRVVEEDTGTIWRNVVAEGVGKVADTLEEFRGRHRYPLLDEHVRALYAEVPTISQWDDHETCNNWYPGEVLDDDRYAERRCSVLAARGRRAWQEYQPVPVHTLVDRGGDGFATDRIYRKVPRGAHLDLFCLDMRTYRGPNPTSAQPGQPGLLGPEQERWLVSQVTASTATWKVISADLPLSAPSNHLDDLDSAPNGDDGPPAGREPELARVLTAFQRNGVRNVVWITADVHYTAAHHYSPERAAYPHFDPFWEFVSGPAAAGTFATKDALLDHTFGPEVAYSKGNETTAWSQSPRAGNQFFGHVAIAADGQLTVTLYDGSGSALWSRTLEPDPVTESRR